MNVKTITTALILIAISFSLSAQQTYKLAISLSFSQEIQSKLKPDGRLFVFLNQNPRAEPRTQIWPSPGNFIFARNYTGLNAANSLELKGSDDWDKTQDWSLDQVPEGEYYLQLVWDQDTEESRINAPGNLFSKKEKIVINKSQILKVAITEIIPPREIVGHKLVKLVDLKSDTLSAWWKKDMHLKATILLPANYEQGKSYPIRYNVAGYGGRYTRINNLANSSSFMDWWESGDAPAVINVFLDGEGPFGDSYQMDSDNSGPYGYALINELIPHIENEWRGTTDAKTRFVDGCSTGGWVSLGLQIYYPDAFNGVFSYSPDAIVFEDYQLINVYKDENAFVNEFGYLRPVWRNTDGEPFMDLKKFIQYENVLGASGTYVNSGGQFSAHNALYSPKGENGLPKPIFNAKTGKIDHSVAETWKKYDFKLYAKENWSWLGPKLQGKIYVWMGDMDNFYLNIATRTFDAFLKTTENPKSDAEIVFTATEGHCQQFSHRRVLEQIQERLEEIK